MNVPSKKEFCNGVQEFEKHEKRDAMYGVATFLVEHFWGNYSEMTNGIGVLLLTWNNALYRYGIFDFDKLEDCVEKNFHKLTQFRKREIDNMTANDESEIITLFQEFFEALAINPDTTKSKRSYVGASKALHLLAPQFFPLWDYKISRAYGYNYYSNPTIKYIKFCKVMQNLSRKVYHYTPNNKKSILKLIDEYNYSKYTKNWI